MNFSKNIFVLFLGFYFFSISLDLEGKSVAIIGSGPSGLASAKSAKEVGLDVTIFEASCDIGGLWNPVQGATWNSLNTNLSKFTCNFSDFPWPSKENLFPTRDEMYYYFKAYINHFDLFSSLQLNTTVINLKRDEINNQWIVTYKCQSDSKTFKKPFDFVIVASGFFSKPKFPNLNFNKFKGVISHTKFYKDASQFEDLTVAVVGGAFSAVEIATDVCKKAKKVYHLSTRGLWISPKCMKISGRSVPLDLVFFLEKNSNSLIPRVLNPQLFYSYKSRTQELVPYLSLDFTTTSKPPLLVTSETYPQLVQEEKITMINKPIKDLAERSIIFEDESLDVDAIIFCKGFSMNLPFFDEKFLQKLSFDPQQFLYPLVLYESVFHPDIPNLAFVGMYRRSYIGIMELQARWATLAFINPKKYLPSKDIMARGILEIEKKRNTPSKPQSFYGGYTAHMKKLAKAIYVDEILNHPRIKSCPIIPALFRMTGPYSKPEIASQSINQCLEFLGLPRLSED